MPPTIEEVRQLIVECEQFNPDLARLFTLAATTGFRRGELRELHWGDIDFDNATMVVARSNPAPCVESPASASRRPTTSTPTTHNRLRTRKIVSDDGQL
ncbi:MAG: tyrosine-type recombinase/integrase [Acidimicrobiales bacterium]